MKTLFTRYAIKFLLVLTVGSLLPLRVHADATAYISDKEKDRLAGLRYAALHGDRSKIPDLVQALHGPSGIYISTGLHGLEHLQATEALPEIDALIRQLQPDYLLERAKAVRARLLAESDTSLPQPQTQQTKSVQSKEVTATQPQTVGSTPIVSVALLQAMHARVQHVLKNMDLDLDKMKAGVAAYNRAKAKGDVGWSAEVFAANELADMAYYGDYAAFAAQPEVKWLEAANVAGASVKLKYAAIPKPQRAQRMVDDLAKTGVDGELLQLAIDEGLPASRAAAKKLLEMDQHRDQYTIESGGHTYYHDGFASLFRLIAGVGDTEQLPVIQRFLNDRNGYIAYYAHQVYGQVKLGMRKQWAVGY